MNKKNIMLYFCAFCFGIFMLLYISSTYIGTFYQAFSPVSAAPFSEWTVTDLPEENTLWLTQTLPDNLTGTECLGFFTIHQDIHVYLDDSLIYSYDADSDSMLFGKSPGNIWNFIPIAKEYASCRLTVCLSSPYWESYKTIPDFYLGNKLNVLLELAADNFYTFMVAVLIMFIGLFLMGYWLYMKHYYTNDSLFFLGLSTFSIAGWSLVELPITTLTFQNNIALAYAPYIFIIAMPFPFISFARNYFHNQKHKIWSVLIALSLIEMAVCLFLQVTNILDFRHMLFAILSFFGLIFLCIAILTIQEIRLYGLNTEIRFYVFCTALEASGLLIDIIRYYIYDGKSTFFFGNFTFLLSIMILTTTNIYNSRENFEKGKQLARLERLAYRDKLTNLYNRTAFVDYLSLVDTAKSGSFIVSIELNLNITEFHQYNYSDYDAELLTVSQILHDAFAGIGKCYRLGYTEFSVILQDSTAASCEQAILIMKMKCEAYNYTHPASPILFYYGYAEFDSIIDHDIDDTRSRADFLLIQNKVAHIQKSTRD